MSLPFSSMRPHFVIPDSIIAIIIWTVTSFKMQLQSVKKDKRDLKPWQKVKRERFILNYNSMNCNRKIVSVKNKLFFIQDLHKDDKDLRLQTKSKEF